MAVWECCDEEGEAAPVDVESEEVGGCGVEEGAEEAVVAAAAADDDDEGSTRLLCVMKRSRSFMAGRKVMMIFSTWGIKNEKQKNDERFLLRWLFLISIFLPETSPAPSRCPQCTCI